MILSRFCIDFFVNIVLQTPVILVTNVRGMALSAASGRALRLTLEQPGGRLQVESDPESGETWLSGRTCPAS